MKLSEFIKQLLDIQDRHPHEDPKVVIELANPSAGPVATSEVMNVVRGFDWENGNILLRAETDLIKDCKVSVRTLREHLEGVVEHYMKRPAQQRRHCYVDGFIEGAKWGSCKLIEANTPEPGTDQKICELVDQWATRLDNREYLKEVKADEAERAQALGIVIVFGQSDDRLEFRGAVNAEFDSYGGIEVRVDQIGTYSEDESTVGLHGIITALWSPKDGSDLSWKIEANFPCRTFKILEDGKPYCQGIVYHKSVLPVPRLQQ